MFLPIDPPMLPPIDPPMLLPIDPLMLPPMDPLVLLANLVMSTVRRRRPPVFYRRFWKHTPALTRP